MIANRKDDHVRFAAEQQRRLSGYNEFDDVSFVHHALAGIDRSEVSLGTRFGGIEWHRRMPAAHCRPVVELGWAAEHTSEEPPCASLLPC